MECSICYDMIDNDNLILDCNHNFHSQCIISSYHFGNLGCPLCRRIIDINLLPPRIDNFQVGDRVSILKLDRNRLTGIIMEVFPNYFKISIDQYDGYNNYFFKNSYISLNKING